ncbi:MAG: hypothetical protein KJO30_02685 [Boseongicola sp.]|nr:hypothetical protein [Boseongicola sp.]
MATAFRAFVASEFAFPWQNPAEFAEHAKDRDDDEEQRDDLEYHICA